jgi:hypothetical protein
VASSDLALVWTEAGLTERNQRERGREIGLAITCPGCGHRMIPCVVKFRKRTCSTSCMRRVWRAKAAAYCPSKVRLKVLPPLSTPGAPASNRIASCRRRRTPRRRGTRSRPNVLQNHLGQRCTPHRVPHVVKATKNGHQFRNAQSRRKGGPRRWLGPLSFAINQPIHRLMGSTRLSLQ